MTGPCGNKIAGAVLAGGLSRRMGGIDKALAPLDGKPMIAHVFDRLAAQVDPVAVNANGNAARFDELGADVFPDIVSGFAGPLAGIHAAMVWARDSAGATHVVTAAADTPFFPADLVVRLAEAAAGPEKIAMARSRSGLHPVFALWPVQLASDLQAWLSRTDTLKVTDWTQRHQPVSCPFAPLDDGTDTFFNVNTPEDLAEAETILGRIAA